MQSLSPASFTAVQFLSFKLRAVCASDFGARFYGPVPSPAGSRVFAFRPENAFRPIRNHGSVLEGPVAPKSRARLRNRSRQRTFSRHVQSFSTLPTSTHKKTHFFSSLFSIDVTLKGRLHETAKIGPTFAVQLILPGRPSDFCKHLTDAHHIAQNRTEI